jgi:DNA-binding PadR family transcriptional regulator
VEFRKAGEQNSPVERLSENNRKVRYNRLTTAGRKQLQEQTSRWDRLVRAVNRVSRPAEE